MGCTESKLETNEMVQRCKERRRLMKEAFYARHSLASAHSAYCHSLRATGSTLAAFASGEPLPVSDHTPSVLLHIRSPAPPSKQNSHVVISSPSHASSACNWESLKPPPTPPDSEYFEKLRKNKEFYGSGQSDEAYYADYDRETDGKTQSSLTSYSNSNSNSNSIHPFRNRVTSTSSSTGARDSRCLNQNWESERVADTEMEVVECSEWGDHDDYSSTSSSSAEELGLKSENEANTDHGGYVNFIKLATSKTTGEGKSSVSLVNGKDKVMVRHTDLAEISVALREYFDKAADAGKEVSEMLEIGKIPLNGSFNCWRKAVHHGICSDLMSCWTSKSQFPVRYGFGPNPLERSGSSRSLCSTLERLFAWEDDLYQGVKARECIKIKLGKKLSRLQSMTYRDEQDMKMEKAKASVNRLQSALAVTSEGVSATSCNIIRLRDSDLVPQLVELCHGFMYMWKSTNQHHEIQNNIVQQVRGLVNSSTKAESMSDLHRQATKDLELTVTAWHTSFCHMIKFYRDLITSLHGWFHLTTLNGESTNVSDALTFLKEWKLAIARVPDTVASEAIKSFVSVVHSISLKQTEELKMKKQVEGVSKEFENKASSLRKIERKHYRSYSVVDVRLPVTSDGRVLDARDPLVQKKAELSTCKRRLEEEMEKHAKAVEVTRAVTSSNIQTGLPGVFEAMVRFSSMMNEALVRVCERSYAIQYPH